MIQKVQKKRRRNEEGKLIFSRSYYLRYRLDGMPKDRWISLRTTDKQVAEKKARDFISEKEREAAGIIAPKTLREAAQTPLKSHLEDHLADLKRRGKDGKDGRGARQKRSRIENLIQQCGWTLPASVTADSFVAWRSDQSNFAAKTLNEYFNAISGLFNWMEKQGRVDVNPLRRVEKIDERGRQQERRAFTDEELKRLVEGSEERGALYLIGARTGLRQAELEELTWGDVELDGMSPCVRVRATISKNKKAEAIQLVQEVSECFRAIRPEDWESSDRVFDRVPRAAHIQRDCERNGIAVIDARGRKVVFHSLRHTWATFLQRHGVSQRIAMQLMRHSDMKLTAKVYTDESQLPIDDAIKELPRLGAAPKHTHIRAQISGTEGQDVSPSVTRNGGAKTLNTPVNGGARLEVAQVGEKSVVAERERFELSRAFRPRTLSRRVP